MNEPKQKIEQLAEMMSAGDWHKAIRFAARFPQLGKHREPILTAASALLAPELYRQMGRDPDLLVRSGLVAIRDRFPRMR